jgi:hypothetical protein
MAMIAMLSAKAAPGVTTSITLLASVWPGPVVAVDADPAGGDMMFGLLGDALAVAPLRLDRGVLHFVIDTRRSDEDAPHMLYEYLRPVPSAPNCMVLAGLNDRADIRFVDVAGWQRLAHALATVSKPKPTGADVLVDCGRFGPDTPWPLLAAADLVLIATRPQRRYVFPARCLATRLRSSIEPSRLGLAICGTNATRAAEAERTVGLASMMQLPDDLRAARVFSDGTRRPAGLHRTRLVRTAHAAAVWLHDSLNQPERSLVSAAGSPQHG